VKLKNLEGGFAFVFVFNLDACDNSKVSKDLLCTCNTSKRVSCACRMSEKNARYTEYRVYCLISLCVLNNCFVLIGHQR
jgi:hypothetical protein